MNVTSTSVYAADEKNDEIDESELGDFLMDALSDFDSNQDLLDFCDV